jgi:hypothetical protein
VSGDGAFSAASAPFGARGRRRRRRVAGLTTFAFAAIATTVLTVFGACLPDLAAFPDGPDAREASTLLPSVGCGDGVIETLDDGGDAGESCDPGDAQAPGCASCQLTCDGGAIDPSGHCYFVTSPTRTYEEARSACGNAGGHIVTFASLREASFATALVEAAGYGDAGYWVGLDKQPGLGEAYGPPAPVTEPGFPNKGKTCSGCFALGDDAGSFRLYPDDAGTEDRRCLVALGGAWLQASCSESQGQFATLCEREPLGERIYPCGGLLCTTLTITAGRKRYVISQFPSTAAQANDLCRTSYDGGSLVMLDSNEEREQLVRELVSRLPVPPLPEALEVWIGLSLKDGVWTWDDGESTDGGARPQPWDGGARPQPWGNGQPGAGIGRAFLKITSPPTFDTQLARTDEDASSEKLRVFVCERPIE